MKNTLRLIAAAAVLAIAAPVYAQAGGGGGGGGGQQMTPEQRLARQKEMLFKDITLDASQTEKIDVIFKEAAKKQQELMQGGMEAMRSPEGREKMQKVTTERNDAIKAVLTADQKTKFEANLAAMPQGGRRGGS